MTLKGTASSSGPACSSEAREFVGKGDLAMRPDAVGLTWPRAPREDEVRNGVAVVQICGPLEHKGGGGWWSWFESYERILNRFEGALQSEDVHAVILLIDSPGGEVSGLQETVRKMRALRAKHDKPVIAYADDEAYSAAYALACAADEIYLPESGGVGSVGVLATLFDRTKMTAKAGLRVEVVRSGSLKAEGHPDIPLSDATLGRVQRRVDSLARQFFSLVAEARPISRAKLKDLKGALLYGQKAVEAGLADGICSFDQLLDSLSEVSFDNLNSRSVHSKPNDRSEVTDRQDEDTMAFAILQKKVDDAKKALAAASTPAARKKATAQLSAALTALTEAKVKKSYKKKTVEEEEETDDGEAEESDEESEEESDEEESEAKSDEDDDDGEDDDDDDDGDDDEEKSKKMKKGKKASASSLAAFVRTLTGQSSDKSAREVLASMHEAATQSVANAEEIAALKKKAIKSEKDTLVSALLASGKIKPAQVEWAQGETLKTLKAYDAKTPAAFAPRQLAVVDNVHAEDPSAVGADGLTATERKICEVSGVSPETFKKAKASGVTVAVAPKVN